MKDWTEEDWEGLAEAVMCQIQMKEYGACVKLLSLELRTAYEDGVAEGVQQGWEEAADCYY